MAWSEMTSVYLNPDMIDVYNLMSPYIEKLQYQHCVVKPMWYEYNKKHMGEKDYAKDEEEYDDTEEDKA